MDPWSLKQATSDCPITARPTSAQISDIVNGDASINATTTSVPFYDDLSPYDGNFQIHTQLGRY